MANEITMSTSLKYVDSTGFNEVVEEVDESYTSSSALAIKAKLSVPTTEVLIPLGGITPGWCAFKNHHATNYIKILNTTSGIEICRVQPGGTVCKIYMPSAITAPYAISNSTTCLLEYLICST